MSNFFFLLRLQETQNQIYALAITIIGRMWPAQLGSNFPLKSTSCFNTHFSEV